jgi:hypothetical protein
MSLANFETNCLNILNIFANNNTCHCHVKDDKLRIPSDVPVILCHFCISGHSTTIFASLVIFQQHSQCALGFHQCPKRGPKAGAQADPFLVLFHQSVLWVWIPENLAAKRSLNKVEDSISLLCYDYSMTPRDDVFI